MNALISSDKGGAVHVFYLFKKRWMTFSKMKHGLMILITTKDK